MTRNSNEFTIFFIVPPLLIETSGFYLSLYIELEKDTWKVAHGASTSFDCFEGYFAIAFATLNIDRRDEC